MSVELSEAGTGATKLHFVFPGHLLTADLLSLSSGANTLVYGDANCKHGSMTVYDMNTHAKRVIQTAPGHLAHVSVDRRGRLIATALDDGHVISVYDAASGQKKHELLRSFTKPVLINALCFSDDSVFLACSSDSRTINVYDLRTAKDLSVRGHVAVGQRYSQLQPQAQPGFALAAFGQMFGSGAQQKRALLDTSFAFVYSRGGGTVRARSFHRCSDDRMLLLVSDEQTRELLVFFFDAQLGGECMRVRLLSSSDC